MGNCIRKDSSMEWGGDDWGSFGSDRDKARKRDDDHMVYMQEENSLLSKGVLSCSLAAEATEVKIKISKKELEKLVKEADVKGLSIQQVLAQLMNVSDQFEAHQRSWRPALHSIPE